MGRYEWQGERELTSRERAALVAWLLCNGAELTVKDVAEATGLSHKGAWKLVRDISRVVPIYFAEGAWRKCE